MDQVMPSGRICLPLCTGLFVVAKLVLSLPSNEIPRLHSFALRQAQAVARGGNVCVFSPAFNYARGPQPRHSYPAARTQISSSYIPPRRPCGAVRPCRIVLRPSLPRAGPLSMKETMDARYCFPPSYPLRSSWLFLS